MTSKLLTFFIILFVSHHLVAQQTSFVKEAVITTGFGYSHRIRNSSGGTNTFAQMSYRLSENFPWPESLS